MSSRLGRIKDRFRVVRSLHSSVNKSIVKATNHRNLPPKPKHVRRLSIFCRTESEHVVKQIGRMLSNSSDWIVVLKALQVIHQLMEMVKYQTFFESLSAHRSIFNLSSFSDPSTEGFHQSIFIRQYARYLEERVHLFRSTGTKTLFDAEIVRRSDPQLLHIYLSVLQVLVQISPRSKTQDYMNNRVTVSSFALIIQDSLQLFRLLSSNILSTIEGFFDMEQKEALKWLEVYEKFISVSQQLSTLFTAAHNCENINSSFLPEIKLPKDSLLKSMKEYVGQPCENDDNDHDENKKEDVPVADLSTLLSPAEFRSPAPRKMFLSDAVEDDDDDDEDDDDDDDEDDFGFDDDFGQIATNNLNNYNTNNHTHNNNNNNIQNKRIKRSNDTSKRTSFFHRYEEATHDMEQQYPHQQHPIDNHTPTDISNLFPDTNNVPSPSYNYHHHHYYQPQQTPPSLNNNASNNPFDSNDSYFHNAENQFPAHGNDESGGSQSNPFADVEFSEDLTAGEIREYLNTRKEQY